MLADTKRARLGLAGASVVFVVLTAGAAGAEEPVAASEPRLLNETGEVTSVVDAFDDTDPFDVHFWLGFQQRWRSGNIRRETHLAQPGLSTGGFVAATENVARFSQSQTLLNLGADVGIYKDLALVLRLPLVLADSRELSDLDGSTRNPERLRDPNGDQLFTVPFRSPTRSGVDYVSAGLNYAIFNQTRDWTKPTWVVGVEGRFGIGPALHACRDGGAPGTAARCPEPGNRGVDRSAGISRAMTSVVVHTTFARRFGYVEPYAGMSLLAEFPQGRADFGPSGDLAGALLNRPPIVGTFTTGVEVIPWEHREAFQRLVLDFRVRGSYHSPGRDYSELFDALGTSNAATLANPNYASYKNGGNVSVVDPASPRVFFSGVTDQQAFGSFGGHAQVTWQAGEYVKLNLGMGLTFVQSHLITAADACNPAVRGDRDRAGPCRSSNPAIDVTGIPNLHHRAIIDLPGRRFSADDTTILDLWLNGVVMF